MSRELKETMFNEVKEDMNTMSPQLENVNKEKRLKFYTHAQLYMRICVYTLTHTHRVMCYIVFQSKMIAYVTVVP